MIAARPVVTSSGFTFERRGDSVVVSGCEPRATDLAVLEYLREVEPARPGKIVDVTRGSAGGRAVEAVTVELPGGERRTLSFDIGPSALGRVIRPMLDGMNVTIHIIAATAALGAVGYILLGLLAG